MSPSDAEAGAPVRVLVVDDEPDSRELLKIVLEWDGFVVDTCASGEEALLRVASSLPDIVLVDVNMGGIDGYEVASKITGDPASQHVIVVMLTGSSSSDARDRALRAGASGFLTKPADRVTLSTYLSGLTRARTRLPPPQDGG